jgi:hypothetical protein
MKITEFNGSKKHPKATQFSSQIKSRNKKKLRVLLIIESKFSFKNPHSRNSFLSFFLNLLKGFLGRILFKFLSSIKWILKASLKYEKFFVSFSFYLWEGKVLFKFSNKRNCQISIKFCGLIFRKDWGI